MLALSSLSKSSRFVGIMYVGIISSPRPSSACSMPSRVDTVSWISFGDDLAQVVDVIFRLKPRYRRPGRSRCSSSSGCRRHLAVDSGAPGARRGGGDVSAARRTSDGAAAPPVTVAHVTYCRSGTARSSASTTSSRRRAAGRHGTARTERRRQVDVHEADHRSAKPSKGSVKVLGEPIWRNPHLYFQIGFCPEQDAFYERMTGLEWVTRARPPERARREGSRRRRARGR